MCTPTVDCRGKRMKASGFSSTMDCNGCADVRTLGSVCGDLGVPSCFCEDRMNQEKLMSTAVDTFDYEWNIYCSAE